MIKIDWFTSKYRVTEPFEASLSFSHNKYGIYIDDIGIYATGQTLTRAIDSCIIDAMVFFDDFVLGNKEPADAEEAKKVYLAREKYLEHIRLHSHCINITDTLTLHIERDGARWVVTWEPISIAGSGKTLMRAVDRFFRSLMGFVETLLVSRSILTERQQANKEILSRFIELAVESGR